MGRGRDRSYNCRSPRRNVAIGCTGKDFSAASAHRRRCGGRARPGRRPLTHQAEKAAAPARRRRSGVGKKHAQAAPTKAVQRKTLLELTNRTCRWILEAAVKWALTRALSHFP